MNVSAVMLSWAVFCILIGVTTRRPNAVIIGHIWLVGSILYN